MSITIKCKDTSGVWQPFDVNSILHMPVSHACHLFSFKPETFPVVARDGDVYIVNSKALADQYRANKKRVMLFDEVLRDGDRCSRSLSAVGFVA